MKNDKTGAVMSDLKPCPFCGCTEVRTFPPTCNQMDNYDPSDRAFPIARCDGCFASAWGKDWDQSTNQKSAIESWNRRATPAAYAPMLAALERCSDFLNNNDGAGFGTQDMDGSHFYTLAGNLDREIKAVIHQAKGKTS